jgi:hypothetical protein
MGDATEHYWLVQRMAKTTGVDLVRASEAGLLEQAEWASIVTRCRHCQWAEGCKDWLDEPVDETRVSPEPCLNQKRLSALKNALEQSPL